jgi:hypothetical protein
VSDFLFNLATRALGEQPDVRPRLPSMFESPVLDAEPPAQESIRGLEAFDVSFDEESIAPQPRVMRARVHPAPGIESMPTRSSDQFREMEGSSSIAGVLVPNPEKPGLRSSDRGHDEQDRQSLRDTRTPSRVLRSSEHREKKIEPVRDEPSPVPISEPRVAMADAKDEKAGRTGEPIRTHDPGRLQVVLPDLEVQRYKPVEVKNRDREHQVKETTKPKPQKGVFSPQPRRSAEGPRATAPPVDKRSVNEQVINVTIGRIEVRATNSASAAVSPAPRNRQSVMSLDDYLHRRNGSNSGGGR